MTLQGPPAWKVERNGGGRRPGDGLPPPSRSGLVLNPGWTMIG